MAPCRRKPKRRCEMKALEVKRQIALKNILFATDLDVSANRAASLQLPTLPGVDQNSAGPPAVEFENGTQLTGLSSEEAKERLRIDGPNELPSSKPRSVAAIAWEVVKEPIFLLLVACGTIYLFLGDVQEALMLLGFVFVVTGISFYQEHKTERTLEALRDLSS